MRHRGKVALSVDGAIEQECRYNTKNQRNAIIELWRALDWTGKTVHIVITPEAIGTFVAPKRAPEDETVEWVRPKAEYSNKGYQSLIDKYA